MITAPGIDLKDVQAVYSGPEGELWELIMGQQIHIGGFKSSMSLAQSASIGPGIRGVDLCCCNGAGMRFLVRCRGVDSMCGVDATSLVLERGRSRTREEGLSDRIEFVQSDVCNTGLAGGTFDFVWGEDAWCYVVDKAKLITEAVRLVKSGGTIAFTDWILGPNEISPSEAERFLAFMKFPNMQDIDGYASLLEKNGCEVLSAVNTGQFAPHIDLYLQMLDMQLTYDALKIIDFDMDLMGSLASKMAFAQQLAHDDKIIQGRFIARKL